MPYKGQYLSPMEEPKLGSYSTSQAAPSPTPGSGIWDALKNYLPGKDALQFGMGSIGRLEADKGRVASDNILKSARAKWMGFGDKLAGLEPASAVSPVESLYSGGQGALLTGDNLEILLDKDKRNSERDKRRQEAMMMANPMGMYWGSQIQGMNPLQQNQFEKLYADNQKQQEALLAEQAAKEAAVNSNSDAARESFSSELDSLLKPKHRKREAPARKLAPATRNQNNVPMYNPIKGLFEPIDPLLYIRR